MENDTTLANVNTSVMPQMEGMELGQYRVLEKLGTGGMGVVYKAQDLKLPRFAAIKFMLRLGGATSALQRFLRELQICAQLSHPHIVKLFQIGMFQQYPYFVMEYVQGTSLLQYLQTQPMTLSEKLQVIIKIGSALDYAHRHKVIHRDLKPSNIMIRDNGEPVLMDFGIAKITHSADSAITRTGEIIGTLEYMSPEQAEGNRRAIDEQSDVYGLGAVLYYSLTGRPPVAGENVIEKLYQIAEEKIKLPSSLVPDMPVAMDTICMRALEKKKANRYATIQEFIGDIQAYLGGTATRSAQFYKKKQRQRQSVLAGAALLMLPAMVAGVKWMRTTPAEPVAISQKTQDTLKLSWQTEIERYYEQGRTKLSQKNAQEASIYLSKAATILQPITRKELSPKYRQIADNLPHIRIEAAFLAGNYQMVQQLGQDANFAQPPHTPVSTYWYMACAAYRSGHLDEGQRYFQNLEQFLSDNLSRDKNDLQGRHWLAQSLYYQGVISFRKEQFSPAKDKFREALLVLTEQLPALQTACHLYLCACLLVDMERDLTTDELATLGQHWQNLPADESQFTGEILENLQYLYWETKARCWLQMATKMEPPQRQAKTQEVFAILEKLGRHCPPAMYHYLRGKAYCLVEDFATAEAEFTMAHQSDPAQPGPIFSKLDLLFIYPQISRMHRSFTELPFTLLQEAQLTSDPFSNEFEQLEKKCQAQQTHGIPFSPEIFREYFQKLQDPAPELQDVAKLALTSLVPYAQTRQEIEKRLPHAAGDLQKRLYELVQAITVQEAQANELQLLATLSQFRLRGKIAAVGAFYPLHLEFLHTTLQKNPHVFIKFLAAKVLAHIPVLPVRQKLLQTYCRPELHEQATPQPLAPFITKILVARAFREIGYATALMNLSPLSGEIASVCRDQPQHLFCEQDGDEELLQFLLAELLPAQTPEEIKVLGWLMQFGSERVQLAAAAHFTRPAELLRDYPHIHSRLVYSLSQCVLHPQPAIRAMALQTLTEHATSGDNLIRSQWLGLIGDHFLSPQFFRNLVETIPQETPEMQMALLHFWRSLGELLFAMPDKAMLIDQLCSKTRPLWASSNSMIRFQALMTSSYFLDFSVFDTLAKSATLFERVGVMLGWMQGGEFLKKRPDKAAGLWQAIPKQIQNTQDWRSKVLWVHWIGKMDGFAQLLPGDRKNHPRRKVLEMLQDPNPSLRCSAVIAISGWYNIPQKFLEKLQEIVSQDPSPEVQAVAWGILLNHAINKKLPELEQWQATVQKIPGAAGKNCRMGAVWGYALPWQIRAFPPGIARQIRQDQELLWEYQVSNFVKQLKNKNKLKEYKHRLRLIGELSTDIAEAPICQDTLFLQAILYEYDNQPGKLVALAEQMGSQSKALMARFCHLWTTTLIKQGKTNRARQTLEQLLEETCRRPSSNLSEQALYESQVRRSLALVYAALSQKPQERRQLAEEQYLLAPAHAPALVALGECYYLQAYDIQAMAIFHELQMRLPASPEISLWLAKCHARQGDEDAVCWYIQQAVLQNPTLESADIEKYTELRPFVHSSKLKEFWEQKRNF